MERVKGIARHIGILERRATYLDDRIGSTRLSDAARAFEEREQKAINAGIAALKMQARVQETSTDPFLALAGVIDELEAWLDGDTVGSVTSVALGEAVDRARTVLAMYDEL